MDANLDALMTTPDPEVDIDDSTITAGGWVANLLRGADLDVDTSLTAGGISVNASNADSDINLAGTLNLTRYSISRDADSKYRRY